MLLKNIMIKQSKIILVLFAAIYSGVDVDQMRYHDQTTERLPGFLTTLRLPEPIQVSARDLFNNNLAIPTSVQFNYNKKQGAVLSEFSKWRYANKMLIRAKCTLEDDGATLTVFIDRVLVKEVIIDKQSYELSEPLELEVNELLTNPERHLVILLLPENKISLIIARFVIEEDQNSIAVCECKNYVGGDNSATLDNGQYLKAHFIQLLESKKILMNILEKYLTLEDNSPLIKEDMNIIDLYTLFQRFFKKPSLLNDPMANHTDEARHKDVELIVTPSIKAFHKAVAQAYGAERLRDEDIQLPLRDEEKQITTWHEKVTKTLEEYCIKHLQAEAKQIKRKDIMDIIRFAMSKIPNYIIAKYNILHTVDLKNEDQQYLDTIFYVKNLFLIIIILCDCSLFNSTHLSGGASYLIEIKDESLVKFEKLLSKTETPAMKAAFLRQPFIGCINDAFQYNDPWSYDYEPIINKVINALLVNGVLETITEKQLAKKLNDPICANPINFPSPGESRQPLTAPNMSSEASEPFIARTTGCVRRFLRCLRSLFYT